MKDLLGREVKVGNYICYALTAGRSANLASAVRENRTNLAVYQVKEVLNDKIKAVKIDESYKWGDSFYTFDDGRKVMWKHTKWNLKEGKRVEMTPEEKYKVDNKTSTLSMPERIFILDGFSPELFDKDICND